MTGKPLDAAAEAVVADALKAAGYRGAWVQVMTKGSDVVVLASSREVETADIGYGTRIFPKGD